MNDEVHKQQKGVDGWTQIYSNTTVPPAASRAAFSFSASSLDTLARISWGRDSTSFLAWWRKDRGRKTRYDEVTTSGKTICKMV